MRVAAAILSLGLVLGSVLPAGGEPPKQAAYPAVPRQALASTLRIEIWSQGRRIGTGSGVAIAPSRVLTAAHVAEDLEPRGEEGMAPPLELRVEVRLPRHKASVLAAGKVLWADRDLDLAELEVDVVLPVWLELDLAGDVEEGEALFCIGAPAGKFAQAASLGFLSCKAQDVREKGLPFLWQSSNALFFGNSGGPILSARTGKVVGIAVRGTGNAFGLAPNWCGFVPLCEPRAKARLAR